MHSWITQKGKDARGILAGNRGTLGEQRRIKRVPKSTPQPILVQSPRSQVAGVWLARELPELEKAGSWMEHESEVVQKRG